MVDLNVSASEVIFTAKSSLNKIPIAESALQLIRRMPIVAMDALTVLPVQPIVFDRVEISNLSPEGDIREIKVVADVGHQKRRDNRAQPTNWYISTTWTGAPVVFTSVGHSANGTTEADVVFEGVSVTFAF